MVKIHIASCPLLMLHFIQVSYVILYYHCIKNIYLAKMNLYTRDYKYYLHYS